MDAAHSKLMFLFLAAFAAAGSARAANFEVNGVHLGMTREEVQAALGNNIECTDRAPSDIDPSQATCISAAFLKDKTLSDTFAGQKTVIKYHILDGRVARISFLGFPSMAFDHIVKAMETTYGKANVVSEDARVTVRAELVNKRATWGSEGGDMIVFQKYSPGNLDRAYLNFYADSYPKAVRPGR
jgi:hypothetical protein